MYTYTYTYNILYNGAAGQYWGPKRSREDLVDIRREWINAFEVEYWCLRGWSNAFEAE